MHSSPEFRSLKAKVRVLCKQRRIRLEEFMKTFDVHRVKKITVEQFKRALDSSGLQLSSAEVALILTKYRIPNDPTSVDYRRFCDLIDKVFTVKGLESHPELRASLTRHSDATGANTTSQYDSATAAATLSDSDRALLRTVQTKLLAAVMHRGIVLKDVFRDFDRSNAGKVTKPQFVRDVLDLLALTPDELAVLLQVYGDNLDVHYRALHYDICPGAAGAGSLAAAPKSPDRRHFSAPAAVGASMSVGDMADDASAAVLELEAELSELVFRDRIRTKSFFTDFDPLRTGKCSEPQFKRCTKLCFSMLTDRDLDLLVRKYSVSVGAIGAQRSSREGDKVDYVRFCHYIEGKKATGNNNNNIGSPDNTNTIGTDGTSSADDALATIVASTTLGPTKCSRELRAPLSDRETDVLNAVLQRLGTFCATQRVLVKPVFQDFDKGRREYVTRDQFMRVLTLCHLVLASDIETRVVLKRYASAHGDRFVNYNTFCYDLDHSQNASSNNKEGTHSSGRPVLRSNIATEIIAPSTTQQRRSTGNGATAANDSNTTRARSVPMLLRYIKQVVKRDRIRLDEFYRDFDKLRHGVVTAAQFAAGLSASGFALTCAEMQLLADEYASRNTSSSGPAAVDSAGQRLVAWRRFVDDVERVFTVKGLERAPATDVDGLLVEAMIQQQSQRGATCEPTLSPADERLAVQTLVTMRRAIDRQRLSIKPAFEDFDRLQHGVVTATAFERVLATFRLLPLDAAHTRAVVRKFSEPSGSDVNYRAFLHALELVGERVATGSDCDDLVLPGSVAYRQALATSSVATTDAGNAKRPVRDQHVMLTDVSALLADLQRQLAMKRVRLKEFVTDSDKLRTGAITVAKFVTALTRSGVVLDASDVQALSAHFTSRTHSDMIDWRAFLSALDAVGTEDGTKCHNSDVALSPCNDAVTHILERLQRVVRERRVHMKPYFQDYDHNRVSRVSKFQFAAVLDMMQLGLGPTDVQLLAQHFAVRDGRRVTTDVNYLALVLAVDGTYQS